MDSSPIPPRGSVEPLRPRVSIKRHLPERGRPELLVLACGCCCCCCCCVHSVASLAGAAVGSNTGAQLRDANDEQKAAAQGAVTTYWKVVGGLIAVCALLGTAWGGVASQLLGGSLAGLFVAFFFLPFLQLLASGITALMLVQKRGAELHSGLSALGRLTWLSLGFGMIGVAVSALGLFVVTR